MNRSTFYEDVWDVVRLIPPGRVTSYGAIAAYLGTKGSARMVGYAMNACHDQPDVPAHRVVNRLGLLSGQHHFSEENPMAARLMAEGTLVADNQVVDFKRLFWDPMKELQL
jgi:methylated-DNA-protein-cysteine methyltransferase-like protein